MCGALPVGERALLDHVRQYRESQVSDVNSAVALEETFGGENCGLAMHGNIVAASYQQHIYVFDVRSGTLLSTFNFTGWKHAHGPV